MDAERRVYYAIAVEDRAGELFRFTLKMKEAGVNLSGLWAFGVGGGKAKIHAIADDAAALERALRGAGYAGEAHTCFRLAGADQLGALCATLDAIEGRTINLRAADAVAADGRCVAYVWPADEDVEAVGAALGC